jgi:RHS repeat-associated protein
MYEPASSGIYYYHTDPAGTPLAVTNTSGAVVWKGYYEPFGNEYAIQGTIGNDVRFAGNKKDDETGLNYFGARYMDSALGRFRAPDPVGPVDSKTGKIDFKILTEPQRLNAYAYGLNGPGRYVDRDGKNPVLIIILAGLYYFFSHEEVANAPTSTCDNLYNHDAAYNPQVQLGMIPILPSDLFIGEGIYEFMSASGKTYVGQSRDIFMRIEEHLDSGKLLPEDIPSLQTTEVLGGKTAREITEQLRINELGGVENLENIRNPIGPARQDLLPK